MLHNKNLAYILLFLVAADCLFVLINKSSFSLSHKNNLIIKDSVKTLSENGLSSVHIFNGNNTSIQTANDSVSGATNHIEIIKKGEISKECEIILYQNRSTVEQYLNASHPNINKSSMEWLAIESDEQIKNEAQQSCVAFMTKYGFELDDDVVSDEEKSFPIAFSILLHENLQQTAMLLSAIYRKHNIYCIHLDGKVQGLLREALKTMVSCFPNVIIASENVDVQYASVSRLLADISCMKDLLLHKKHKWKYLINLCGQDFPLRTNLEIVRQLKALEHKNFIHGSKDLSELTIKRTKYIHKISPIIGNDGEKRDKVVNTWKEHSPPPFNMTVVKNLAYNLYTREFLEWAISGEVGKTLLEWSMDTYSPDEHYWLMLNLHPDAPGGMKKIYSFDLARAIVWRNTNTQNNMCSGSWRHNICVFGSADVSSLVNRMAPALFANKLDVRMDAMALSCILQWLNERIYVPEVKRDVRNRVPPPKVLPR